MAILIWPPYPGAKLSREVFTDRMLEVERYMGQKALANALGWKDARNYRLIKEGKRKISRERYETVNAIWKNIQWEKKKKENKANIWPFEEWTWAVSEEITARFEEIQSFEKAWTRLLEMMEEEAPEWVLTIGKNLTGWLTRDEKFNMSKIGSKWLTIFGLAGNMGHSPWLYAVKIFVDPADWNYLDIKFRGNNLDKLFSLVEESFESLKDAVLLIGFIDYLPKEER